MKRAILDETLSAHVVSERALVYTTPAILDRPAHVRAASAIAIDAGTFYVLQDDALYLAVIDGDRVDGIAMPRVRPTQPARAGDDQPGRRFEEALGNRLDKPDFEACIAIDNELFAFGSGSSSTREWIYTRSAGVQDIAHAPVFYAALRDAIGALNLEGAAIVDDDLWLFHRGNVGPGDRPAIARMRLAELARAIGNHAPAITVERCDLGIVDGVRLGFTDATSRDGAVVIACAAEASDDAIADGAVIGSRIGVIEDETIRCASVVDQVGSPIKLEGLVLDPTDPRRAWITIDPDDPETPARLCEVHLTGNWPF